MGLGGSGLRIGPVAEILCPGWGMRGRKSAEGIHMESAR